MLVVEPTTQHGLTTTVSSRNSVDIEEFMSSISWTHREIESYGYC